jgi:hypothetical protein
MATTTLDRGRGASSTVLAAAADMDLRLSDIGMVIPHQANLRINQMVAQMIGLPPERMHNNIQKYGNTTAASIPICMNEAIELGKIKPGSLGGSRVLQNLAAGADRTQSRVTTIRRRRLASAGSPDSTPSSKAHPAMATTTLDRGATRLARVLAGAADTRGSAMRGVPPVLRGSRSNPR